MYANIRSSRITSILAVCVIGFHHSIAMASELENAKQRLVAAELAFKAAQLEVEIAQRDSKRAQEDADIARIRAEEDSNLKKRQEELSSAGVQVPTTPNNLSAKKNDQTNKADGQKSTSTTTDDKSFKQPSYLSGLGFGVGLSLTVDSGSTQRVNSAVVVGPERIVRVTESASTRARVMLETHYFFKARRWDPFLGDSGGLNDRPCFFSLSARCGFGPFFAIEPGGDNVINAVGLGIMVGIQPRWTIANFSAEELKRRSSSSFNIGIGWVIDPNTQTLGDGIFANQPLPPGEEMVRFQRQTQQGLLIISSFSF